jgi:hypothetical protein
MQTIETIATVNHEGRLTIALASELPPGTHRAVVVIDEAVLTQTAITNGDVTAQSKPVQTAWTALRAHAGTIEMPEDWSKEHDHYLYGTPKRESD